MPLITIASPVAVDLRGKTITLQTFQKENAVIIIGTPTKNLFVTQLAGMTPFKLCTPTECRVWNPVCCYRNPVFGNIVAGKAVTTPTYENDFSSFIVSYKALGTASINFELQQLVGSTWTDVQLLNTNDYGTYYAQGTIAGHISYTGYKLNWGAVLNDYGVGIYRVKLSAVFAGTWVYMCSEEFDLMAWNCDRANGTVKFETYITGKIGDKRIDYLLHDFSGFTWYDSIRVRGYFGYEKVTEYRRVNLEWGNPYHGKIQKVRDEAVQSFEFNMRQDTPKYIHDGLMIYGMMADNLFVSDYNLLNADYNIKQLGIVADSNYEPTYYNYRRTAMVKLNFKRAVQSVIKTNC